MDNLIDFSDLGATDDELKATRVNKHEQRFPCGQCGGTGLYQGARVHQAKSHCFACKGTGYFKTDPRKLRDNRARAAQRKQDAKRASIEAFKAEHEGMYADLRAAYAARVGSTFEISLAEQLFDRGTLTPNQIAAWYRGKEKLAQRIAEQKQAEATVNLDPIRAMFEKAVASGYKKPCYRAEGLKISRAPDTGRNPGALYVVRIEDDTYLGKIEGTTYEPSRDGKEAVNLLTTIAADPLAAAVRYGQRTGTCSCCGRLLTNHTSIDLGIGPICRSRWGL